MLISGYWKLHMVSQCLSNTISFPKNAHLLLPCWSTTNFDVVNFTEEKIILQEIITEGWEILDATWLTFMRGYCSVSLVSEPIYLLLLKQPLYFDHC